jgi:hypothetical protein
MKAAFALFMSAVLAVPGISQEKSYALMVGDPAPAIEVSRFVKGEPCRS